MNRSLTRNVLRAARQAGQGKRPRTCFLEAEHVFPAAAFADAPAPWNPGPGFTEVAGGAWIRDNADGTQSAVVTGVGPKQLPAADGGEWTEEEVWTVTSADPSAFAWLGDKPHRVTWALGREDVEIVREPYAGHPAQAYQDYWHRFYLAHWFTPEQRADGRYALRLACSVDGAWDDGPGRLLSASNRVLSDLGGRVRIRSVPAGDLHRSPSAAEPVRTMQFLSSY